MVTRVIHSGAEATIGKMSRQPQRNAVSVPEDVHAPAPTPPIKPRRAAPARRGIAGISADGGARIKSHVTLSKRLTRQHYGFDPHTWKYDRLARGLGVMSIALGTAELLASQRIARWLGMERSAAVFRAHGVREIVHGASIFGLADPRKRGMAVWARVAGDVADAATLAMGRTRENPKRDRVAAALAVVAAIAVVDIACAASLARRNGHAFD